MLLNIFQFSCFSFELMAYMVDLCIKNNNVQLCFLVLLFILQRGKLSGECL